MAEVYEGLHGTCEEAESHAEHLMASRPFRVRMSAALAEAFEKDMKKAGYGPRKKGVWVGEALHQLERTDPQLTRCGVGDELDSPRCRSLGITLEREDFSLLQSLVLRFRQGSPLVEGVRALVVRSAIRNRIRFSSKTSSTSSS